MNMFYNSRRTMALSIKNSEAESLAREVARRTGETLTEAIRTALAERLERLRTHRASSQERTRRALGELLTAYRSLPLLDERTPDEILGYDEEGLP